MLKLISYQSIKNLDRIFQFKLVQLRKLMIKIQFNF